MKYKVKQIGKKWAIVRILDDVIIDSWDFENLATRRLEAIEVMNLSWDKKNAEKANKAKDL